MSAPVFAPVALGARLVIVDGRYDASASSIAPGELTLEPTPDGLRVRLGEGARPKALVVEHRTTGLAAVCFRLRVEAGPNSRLTLVERHAGSGLGRAPAATELALAAGATLHHTSLALSDGPDRRHVRLEATVGAEATYMLQAFTLGGRARECELSVTLAAEGAEALIDGFDVVFGDERAVTRAAIMHAAPHTRSRQRQRVLAGDRGRGEFHGRIEVARGAAFTDAAQSSRALLLDDGAWVEARPELAIFADAVTCAHGTAIGQLDEAAMFYLRSRGLDERSAREALIVGFAAEVLDRAPTPSLREAVVAALARRLAGKEGL